MGWTFGFTFCAMQKNRCGSGAGGIAPAAYGDSGAFGGTENVDADRPGTRALQARWKAQLDHNTYMKEARMEGEKIGTIQLCERLLTRAATPTEQLVNGRWTN